MVFFHKSQIESVLDPYKILKAIESGLTEPNLNFPNTARLYLDAPGSVIIKYGGAKKGMRYFVRITSNFEGKGRHAMSQLFDGESGELLAILQDEGVLTQHRGAATVALSAKMLAPPEITCIGLIGMSSHKELILHYLGLMTSCRDVLLYGEESATIGGFRCNPSKSIEFITKQCNLLIVNTPGPEPILFGHHIQKGTHISAIGSGEMGKRDLDPYLFEKALRITCDSKEQSFKYGEIHHALSEGLLIKKHVYDLGDLLLNPELRRNTENEITIADLTGAPISDLMIASMAFDRLISPIL